MSKCRDAITKKVLERIGMEGTNLNITKAICEIPTANIIINREKLEAIPLKLE